MSNTVQSNQLTKNAEPQSTEELIKKLNEGGSISKMDTLRVIDEGILAKTQFVAG